MYTLCTSYDRYITKVLYDIYLIIDRRLKFLIILYANVLLIICFYSCMRLVFPIAMHTIETIKQHNTCTFYIHKSKKRKRSKNSTLQW